MTNYLTGMSASQLSAVEEKLWTRVAVHDCWLWTGLLAQRRRPDGTWEKTYGRIQLGQHPRGGSRQVHRIVWELLVGPTPDKLEPDHLCRVKACCNTDHIEWVTHAENMRRGDIWNLIRRKDRCPQGHAYDMWIPNATRGPQRGCSQCVVTAGQRHNAKRHPGSREKLTCEKVIAMRVEFATDGVRNRDLAMKYGVSTATVTNVTSGHTWVNAGGPIAVKRRT